MGTDRPIGSEATVASSPESDATMPASTDTMVSGSGSTATAPLGQLATISPSAYQLGSEIARGGMGRILRAHDRRLDRDVAIKELLHRSPDAKARFEREALITARLQHPSIVPIYEGGTWPSGEPFYAMKLVAGRPLDQMIGETTTLAERIAVLPQLLAVCEALAYAHDREIIHRDLKPHNVLVGDFGETVVIDWGLAKDLTTSDRDRDERAPAPPTDGATLAGDVMGTPAYMPPEQAAGEPVDKRADVYSLGAMLYQLLAKRMPYEARDPATLLASVLAGPPSPITTIAEGLPPDLVTIVEKAMARAPADRYADAGGLAADLKRYLTGQLVAVHQYSFGQLVRRWFRRHRTAVIVATIAMAVLIVGGVLAVSRVLSERDVANTERDRAETEKRSAQRTSAVLLSEQGRQAWLAGEHEHAAAWLAEAVRIGPELDRPGQILAGLVGQALSVRGPRIEAEATTAMLAGKELALATRDGTRVFDVVSGREVGKRRSFVAASRDGRFVVERSDTGFVLSDGKTTIPTIPLGALDVAVSDRGERVVGFSAGKLDVWSAGKGTATITLPPLDEGREAPGTGIACDAGCATVAVWHGDLAFVSIDDGKVERMPLATRHTIGVALAPAGDRFLGVVGTAFTHLAIGGTPLARTSWSASPEVPTGADLTVVDRDARTILVQPTEGPAVLRSVNRTYGTLVAAKVKAAGFAVDGTLVTAHDDRVVRVWNDQGRNLAANLGGGPAQPFAIQIDGGRVVVAGRATSQLWQLQTQIERTTIVDNLATSSARVAGDWLVLDGLAMSGDDRAIDVSDDGEIVLACKDPPACTRAVARRGGAVLAEVPRTSTMWLVGRRWIADGVSLIPLPGAPARSLAGCTATRAGQLWISADGERGVCADASGFATWHPGSSPVHLVDCEGTAAITSGGATELTIACGNDSKLIDRTGSVVAIAAERATLSGDGSRLVGIRDRQIVVLERDGKLVAQVGRQITSVVEHRGVIYALDHEGTLTVWDRDRGKLLAEQRMGTNLGQRYLAVADVTGGIVVTVASIGGGHAFVDRWRVPLETRERDIIVDALGTLTAWRVDDSGRLTR